MSKDNNNEVVDGTEMSASDSSNIIYIILNYIKKIIKVANKQFNKIANEKLTTMEKKFWTHTPNKIIILNIFEYKKDKKII